jgi:hypothetical protein
MVNYEFSNFFRKKCLGEIIFERLKFMSSWRSGIIPDMLLGMK